MLEDLLYEVLPVIGFAIIASSVLIIIVMRKETKNSLIFCLCFAISDLLSGIGTLIDGFYGVIVTIYGNTVEAISPFDCLLRAINVPIFLITDYLHVLLLAAFAIDRLIQIIFPVSYGKFYSYFINWKLFILLIFASTGLSVQGWVFPLDSRFNSSVRVMSQCRFDEVVGEEYYLKHILTVQWSPIICVGILFLNIVLYCIRQSKHKWSYNWSEEGKTTKQLFATIFIRCFLSGLSVHVPLLVIARTTEGHELIAIKDHIIRVSYWIFVIIFQPLWHFLILSSFQSNVYSLFNRYSENTERKWQSANDPPEDGATHLDRHGSPNPFGSWYSMTGNITGEAGLPVGNERSVSFYYQE
ncbi:G-protein coupled receptors family 1 profile domain-containing protein [Caenorhabditis elegans]|uniref:G-protein coupled receptors family 1 profile domain-containing protein n=1 Tax=Caenorhabditis elegans TaxID=6239 RepID=Q17519_CAEEL|nr:G-protein coupled receptors family 1 profile domain-containing protein [Caenorhabditis elegans]CCD62049.1 G-protein coupled receptors family 1 profile domain-containing protein [Caenorhabditis elegans]|eukprot:NP_501183.1 Serpentine Receptor, class TX [Caenorhabditis elegans]